jgi:hypothetical protein
MVNIAKATSNDMPRNAMVGKNPPTVPPKNIHRTRKWHRNTP